MRRSLPIHLAFLVLAGCDAVFGLHHLPPIDAAPDAPPCVTTAIHDSFDSAPPCAAWGFADQDGLGTTVTVVGGQLVIQPAANVAATRGGCLANGDGAFTPETGVFVESGSPGAGLEYKFLAADWSSFASVITWSAGSIDFGRGPDPAHPTSYGNVAFDPVKTRWVRMRPLADGSAIVAETAPDGVQWTQFGLDAIAPPSQVRLSLYGGTFSASATPPSIVFDGLNACPP